MKIYHRIKSSNTTYDVLCSVWYVNKQQNFSYEIRSPSGRMDCHTAELKTEVMCLPVKTKGFARIEILKR
jgi:hypothetical protein